MTTVPSENSSESQNWTNRILEGNPKEWKEEFLSWVDSASTDDVESILHSIFEKARKSDLKSLKGIKAALEGKGKYYALFLNSSDMLRHKDFSTTVLYSLFKPTAKTLGDDFRIANSKSLLFILQTCLEKKNTKKSIKEREVANYFLQYFLKAEPECISAVLSSAELKGEITFRVWSELLDDSQCKKILLKDPVLTPFKSAVADLIQKLQNPSLRQTADAFSILDFYTQDDSIVSMARDIVAKLSKPENKWQRVFQDHLSKSTQDQLDEAAKMGQISAENESLKRKLNLIESKKSQAVYAAELQNRSSENLLKDADRSRMWKIFFDICNESLLRDLLDSENPIPDLMIEKFRQRLLIRDIELIGTAGGAIEYNSDEYEFNFPNSNPTGTLIRFGFKYKGDVVDKALLMPLEKGIE